MAVLEILPHGEKGFPDLCDDVGGPEGSGLGFGVGVYLLEIGVLEPGPCKRHASLEQLAPAEDVLFVDELVIIGRGIWRCWYLCFVKFKSGVDM
jgi:hypothetical protein